MDKDSTVISSWHFTARETNVGEMCSVSQITVISGRSISD